MRRIPLLFASVVGAVCAAYTVIYLVRWEWNRALIAAVFFVAVEVLVLGAVLFERLRRIEDKLDAASTATSPPDPALEVLQANAPDLPDRFGWIREQTNRTNVFLPVLLGAGVVASALAWAVENVARVTLSPAFERRLAGRLHALAPPAGGLLGPPTEAPARPSALRRRLGMTGVGLALLVAVILTGAGIDFVADRTQSRPFTRAADVTTTVEVEVLGTVADRNPERIFGHLWAACTAPGILPGRGVQDAAIAQVQPGHFRIDIDFDIGANYEQRLRGCLHDATIDRVQARVVDITVQ